MASLAAAVAFTGGCVRPTASSPTSAQPVTLTAAPEPGLDESERLNVLEAVFRHQFDHNASASRRNVDYFFLGLGRNEDPPADLLARFTGETPQVLPMSMSEVSRSEGVKHRERGGRGLIFRIWSLRWVDDDTAIAEGGYFEGNLSASGNTYRVERRGGQWTVTADRLNWIA
jgi:hypothetical protein